MPTINQMVRKGRKMKKGKSIRGLKECADMPQGNSLPAALGFKPRFLLSGNALVGPDTETQTLEKRGL